MEAGTLSHLQNCHAGCWTKSLQFQSTFDIKSLLLSTYFLKLFHDLTHLTQGSEQRKALFPPGAAELHQQGCTWTWGLHLPASPCAVQPVSYTRSHTATWKIEHGLRCVSRGSDPAGCTKGSCLLAWQTWGLQSTFAEGTWNLKLKLLCGFWWEKDLSFRVRYRCLENKNHLAGAKVDVSDLNMRCDPHL